MIRPAAGLATLTIVLAAALGGGVVVREALPPEGKTIRLTAKQFKTVVVAQDGDLIELWLPSSMSYGWVHEEASPLLRREKLKPEELREIQKSQIGADGVPVAGKPGVFAGRYRVIAPRDATAAAKWTFCKFGDLKKTEEQLKSGQIESLPEFRPEMKAEDLKPGMVYQITIQARAR